MKVFSTYSAKITNHREIFVNTVLVYRNAVNFYIKVSLEEWDTISAIECSLLRQQYVERISHRTGKNPGPKYDFDKDFYKFPSYLRRSAISEAIGKVSSYKSNLKSWNALPYNLKGKKPSLPKAGHTFPCMYKTVMYEETGTYTVKIKIYTRRTWDWVDITLKKSDVNYIRCHCASRKQCAPTLMKRHKNWFLDFPFEETCHLKEKNISERIVAAVDLGINSAATVSIMKSDGTIIGRHFLKLPKEQDSLNHALNRIKKAQQHGNRRTPRLWAKAKGINDDIAVKTASFIINTAKRYKADVIVFEALDKKGKKHGRSKQKLHMWKSQYVQRMVTDKAHRLSMRISHVCAWNTSRLAFDGSGRVLRGKEADLNNYSVCKFTTGKVYNCDLSASYNIGSRYFVRELLKSLSVKAGLALRANVPRAAKRSTCTLSTLISLNAELMSA